MDFDPTPEMTEAAGLAARILGDRCTQARLREVETSGARFDRDLWDELGAAGLVGLPFPQAVGGGGLGLLELSSVLVEVGRRVAPVPLAWHAVAGMALGRFGTTQQQRSWLAPAAAGGRLLSVALSEDRGFAPERPLTTAERAGGRWRLTGSKTVVAAGTLADLVLVPADAGSAPLVLAVRPDDPGVTLTPQVLNDGDVVARLELDGVELDDERMLGGPGETARWLARHAVVALCAQQLGVVEGALALTASYARSREQFGRPIGSFQAVSQRLADGYIDVQGARLTLWRAAWRLAHGLSADAEVATAKLWAADAGHRVAHTTVHVHGGVGIDLDGAAHRYFTAAKRLELTLGGATEQARALGRLLAAEPV